MWLWYLELYVLTLACFVAGGLVGLLLVRVAVRLTPEHPTVVATRRPTPAVVTEDGP